jgi:vacuolar-type H+-ATPase subunit I/STV1
MIDTSWHSFEPGSWQEAIYDVFVGIYVGSAHILTIAKLFCWTHFVQPLLSGLGVHTAEKPIERTIEENKLKVIGVGYGRTGTVSRNHGHTIERYLRSIFRCRARTFNGLTVGTFGLVYIFYVFLRILSFGSEFLLFWRLYASQLSSLFLSFCC